MLDLLLGDGKSIGLFMNLTILSLPNIILSILPISGLISAIYLTNRLNIDSELTILKSAGTSNLELSKPYFKMGLIVSLLVGVLSHQIVPMVRGTAKNIEHSVSDEMGSMFLKSGEFSNPDDNITMYIGKLTNKKEMNNFFLEDRRDSKKIKTFISETAYLAGNRKAPQIVLRNGSAQTYLTEEKSLDILYFKDFLYDLKVIYEKKTRDITETSRELPTINLIHSLKMQKDLPVLKQKTYSIEIHNRIAKTLLPTIIIILGFSCLVRANFSRHGSWIPIALSITSAIFLELLDNYFEDLIRTGSLSTWGSYITSFLGGLLALSILLCPKLTVNRKIEEQFLP